MPELGLLIRGAAIILWLLISQTPSTCCVHATVSGGSCIASERDALLSFKANLLDPAGRLSSWKGEGCCQWKGVRCNNRTGHVVKLNLRNTDLYNNGYDETALSLSRGEMSSSLVALQHLRYLDLSCNFFNGTSVPVFVGSLKKLRYLNLSDAGFSGTIPSQLGNLSNLQYLDVSFNDLNGTIPSQLGNLSNLQYLNVSLNPALYAVDLSWLPRLSLLRHLDVRLNSLIGTIPSQLGNISNLQYLDVSLNSLKGTIPSQLGNLSNLQYLDVGCNSLNGTIPSQLGNLSNLQYLDVSFNPALNAVDLSLLPRLSLLRHLDMGWVDLSSVRDWVHWVNMLPALKVLRLSECGLNSTISAEIGALGNLKMLDLSRNSFSGPVPARIGALGNLTVLDLSVNELNGVLLKEHFEGLANIEHLDLSVNELNGVLLKEHFEGLANLVYLDLSYNSFKVAIEANWAPPFKLKVAGFRSCHLGPHFPPWLRWQTDMDFLDLGNTNLDDVMPDWFWVTFSRASSLDASENKLRGSLPANLQHMSADEIYLGSNKFTGQVPQLPINISRLNLSSNSLSGSLPSDLKAPLLEELLIANNQIAGTIPSSICQLTGLKRLDLSGNNLTEVMQCWKESDNRSSMANANSAHQFGSIMQSLALNNNDLSGELPRFLLFALKLSFLDLSYNRFSGSLPGWIPMTMPNLEILRVRSNMFTGHIPERLTNLSSLHYLDIAHNNISGTIPWSLSNLKSMTALFQNTEFQNAEEYIFEESISIITKGQERYYTSEIYNEMVNLDLSSNSLTGHVPEAIHLLIGLTNLNLSSNQLNGTIPNQIGDLKNLESLDLSYNEFSGEIPSSFSALTSLSHLNLSYNNLSGAIPSGPQLQVLDNQVYIYIGNPGLCGPPLSTKCSTNESKQSVHEEEEDRAHTSFLYLGMSIGFVIGLWVVFCTMLVKKTWMIAYFRLIDKLYDDVYVQVARLMGKNRYDAA